MPEFRPFQPFGCRARRWSPARLFSGGAQGIFIDPSVLSSLSQDTAGAIPVTGPGQSVGRALDRSGRSNHAKQETAAAKPTLGRHPRGGRRNLVPRNDWTVFPNGPVSGTFSASGLAFVDSGALSAGVSVDILGSGDDAGVPYIDVRIYGTNGTGSSVSATFRQNVLAAAQGYVTVSFRARTLAGTNTGIRVAPGAQVLNNGSFVRGVSTSSEPFPLDAVLTGTTQLVPPENQVNYVAATVFITAGSTVDITIRVSGLQLEAGSVATPPQKVLSQYDVTEAGVQDVWYLGADGIDDWLETPSFTLGASGRTIISAVRKTSDTAIGSIIEHRPAWTQAGGIAQFAPGANGIAGYGFRWHSTAVQSILGSPSDYIAPDTAILSSTAQTGSHIARVNGAQVASESPTGVSGSLTAAMTIGRRDGSSLPFAGNIYGLFVIDRVLTDAELSRVERYFANRIGVTLA